MLRSGSELRLLARWIPFRRTPFDWLIVLFLATAWVGYWAAYDQVTAWNKVWLIVLAVLLYYVLAGQPRERLEGICIFLFCIGVGVSIYFFLTHDFVALPRRVELVNRIGRWLMEVRPGAGWTPIHPNHVGGVVAITIPFILYPARKLLKRGNRLSVFFYALTVLGLGVALFATMMVTSRGIIMAIASALGIWIIWWVVSLLRNKLRIRRERVFPTLVLVYLSALVLFLYAGPANLGYSDSGQSDFGTGSRAELLARSIYLTVDFPFTGGGLGAFPGLYSYYMLGLPFFNVPNSHNLFLDVAIEQGLPGGLSFLSIFLMSIWFSASAVAKTDSPGNHMFAWLTHSALIIAFVHGLVDDYLYLGIGTLLCLVLAGLSMTLQPAMERAATHKSLRFHRLVVLPLIGFLILNFSTVRSTGSANLGAVQMAKVELAGFPTGKWTEPSILPKLEQANVSFQSALEADPTNRTANHRLGLIAMLRGDYSSAVLYLEKAHQEAPNHRGIIKALGYSYAWLGDIEEASLFLGKIPEARHELGVYSWWWETQGRPDLSEKATLMLSRLDSTSQ